jgi:hypothetical protein
MLALLGVHQQNVDLDYIYMCQAKVSGQAPLARLNPFNLSGNLGLFAAGYT